MQVKALSAGYYGSYRETGDVFEVPDGETATWFEPIVEPIAPEAEKKKPEGRKKPEGAPLA